MKLMLNFFHLIDKHASSNLAVGPLMVSRSKIIFIIKVYVRIVSHKLFYIHPIFRNRQAFWNTKSFHPQSGLLQSLICYNIKHSKLHGLLQGMEGFCVSKCLPVPENGMNIEYLVVKYSDIDFNKFNIHLGHIFL